MSMFNGEPGHGKSMASLDIAARLTVGKNWPDGQENRRKCSVILLTEEEDAADTILPRFLAADGDPKKLLTVKIQGGDQIFKIEQHLELLERKIEEAEENVRLVIFDPVIDYTKAKQNVDEEVRPVLTRLRKWAEKHGARSARNQPPE